MTISPLCVCTTVSARGLEALLESSGRGTYRSEHPWLVARRLWRESAAAGQRLPIVFATESPLALSHWAFLEEIEVLELHRSSWATACSFTPLTPVNPIFTDIDSLFLQSTAERLERERIEGIHQHRYPLTAAELHPYAICETPPFMAVAPSHDG